MFVANKFVIPGRAMRKHREGKGTQVVSTARCLIPGSPSLAPRAERAMLAGDDNAIWMVKT